MKRFGSHILGRARPNGDIVIVFALFSSPSGRRSGDKTSQNDHRHPARLAGGLKFSSSQLIKLANDHGQANSNSDETLKSPKAKHHHTLMVRAFQRDQRAVSDAGATKKCNART
jgi:hypothetical protein